MKPKFRNCCSQVFFKIGTLKNFAIFTGKHLCWNSFIKWLQLGVFSYEYFSCDGCQVSTRPSFFEADLPCFWIGPSLLWLLPSVFRVRPSHFWVSPSRFSSQTFPFFPVSPSFSFFESDLPFFLSQSFSFFDSDLPIFFSQSFPLFQVSPSYFSTQTFSFFLVSPSFFESGLLIFSGQSFPL